MLRARALSQGTRIPFARSYSTRWVPPASAWKIERLRSPRFIQLPETSTCGIVAASQIYNWSQDNESLLVDRDRAIEWAERIFKTDRSLAPYESAGLAIRLSKNIAGANKITLPRGTIDPISVREQWGALIHHADGSTQFLATFNEHAIAIHDVYPELNLVCVSGLPDGEGGYQGPKYISIDELFGKKPVTLGSKGLILPPINVTAILKKVSETGI